MKKFLLVGTCLIALCAFQVHASPQANAGDFNVGSVVGGLFGGVLGSTVGKGSGKLWATGAGAVLGTIVGTNLGQGNQNARAHNAHHHHHRQHHRRYQRYEYVEVCKSWPYLYQDHHGDYYTVMRDECRIVKRAVW